MHNVIVFTYVINFNLFQDLVAVFPYLGKYVYPCALLAETGTIYLTILVTLNRYISVCFPYRATDLCSLHYARIHVAIIAAFSILFNLPRFFEYDIVTVTTVLETFMNCTDSTNQTIVTTLSTRIDLSPTVLLQNKPYKIIYSNLLYFLV